MGLLSPPPELWQKKRLPQTFNLVQKTGTGQVTHVNNVGTSGASGKYMPYQPHISVVIGTRPEAIKMAPVIHALAAAKDMSLSIISTGQHREMLEQVLTLFALEPDVDLHLMTPNQSLSSLTEKALNGLTGYLAQAKPDMLLVQGDAMLTA